MASQELAGEYSMRWIQADTIRNYGRAVCTLLTDAYTNDGVVSHTTGIHITYQRIRCRYCCVFVLSVR